MEHRFVVTHVGPCTVPKKLYEDILDRKKRDVQFGSQILFSLDLSKIDHLVDCKVEEGDVPFVKTMEQFEARFILQNPPGRRNIIV
jgi:hypothetical protein